MRPALRVVEREFRVYRRTWRASLATTFANPVLYLAAMGLGLGSLVDRAAGPAELGVPYVSFLAPGLLVATAMQSGASLGTFGVMMGIKWGRSWHALLASPIDPPALLWGHTVWGALRLLLTAGAFVAVLAAFGALPLHLGLAAAVPAILTGLAFHAPLSAWAALKASEIADLSAVFRFGIVPMFLFSGVFFPVTQLPGWLQPVAYATPLWHGVALARAISLGLPAPVSPLVSLLYLGALIVGGLLVARRGFTRRLTP